MFDHKQWQRRFREQPGYNDSNWVSVTATPRATWQCIGVHHLSGAENRGKHNVFIDVLTHAGERAEAMVHWTWEGRRPNEMAPPLSSVSKPPTEPGCNITMTPGQKVSVWVEGIQVSDVVSGLHTALPDEPPGNTWGHHSYYVVFQKVPTSPPPPSEPPAVPSLPPDTDWAALYSAATEMSQKLVELSDILWQRIIIPLERGGVTATEHEE